MVENAKKMATTLDTYWVPGDNHLKTHRRWTYVEFTGVYKTETDFAAKTDV